MCHRVTTIEARTCSKIPIFTCKWILEWNKRRVEGNKFSPRRPRTQPFSLQRYQDGKISKCEHIFSSSITGEGCVRRLRHHGVAFNPLPVDRKKALMADDIINSSFLVTCFALPFRYISQSQIAKQKAAQGPETIY